jgi:flagellar basal-body rod protein FlgG
MSDALAIAISGLKSEEYYIDKLANDLANLNTANYKSTQITFADMLYHPIDGNQHLNSPIIGLGTAAVASQKDFSQGPLKPSSNWNDLAIDGSGFFQVLDEEGNVVYTRNSTLTIDSERYLATQAGLRLADNIQIPEDALEIVIQKNGDVEARLNDDTTPQRLGSIKLAKFVNPESLHPLGSGIYTTTEKTAEALIDSPSTSGLGQLLQKQVEVSNVDMVNTLMQLTMAQRIYQLNAKAVQIADEMEKMVNEIRD